MFMNLAHRGASEYAPENTLAAFYKGLEMGANGLETDLRRTKDGYIVLQHDQRVDRNTDGTGDLSAYTWQEASRLDAGSSFSDAYRGEPLVLLDTFLQQFARRPILLAIELKETGMEQALAARIKEWNLYARATVTSFDPDALTRMRRADEQVRLGYLTKQWDEPTRQLLRQVRAVQYCPNASIVTRELVQEAEQFGCEVRAWGIRDDAQMTACLEAGVIGMTANAPDRLHALLAK